MHIFPPLSSGVKRFQKCVWRLQQVLTHLGREIWIFLLKFGKFGKIVPRLPVRRRKITFPTMLSSDILMLCELLNHMIRLGMSSKSSGCRGAGCQNTVSSKNCHCAGMPSAIWGMAAAFTYFQLWKSEIFFHYHTLTSWWGLCNWQTRDSSGSSNSTNYFGFSVKS